LLIATTLKQPIIHFEWLASGLYIKHTVKLYNFSCFLNWTKNKHDFKYSDVFTGTRFDRIELVLSNSIDFIWWIIYTLTIYELKFYFNFIIYLIPEKDFLSQTKNYLKQILKIFLKLASRVLKDFIIKCLDVWNFFVLLIFLVVSLSRKGSLKTNQRIFNIVFYNVMCEKTRLRSDSDRMK